VGRPGVRRLSNVAVRKEERDGSRAGKLKWL